MPLPPQRPAASLFFFVDFFLVSNIGFRVLTFLNKKVVNNEYPLQRPRNLSPFAKTKLANFVFAKGKEREGERGLNEIKAQQEDVDKELVY